VKQLVLSLFPGIDLLGYAFKREGFCVTQGGDVIFGGDIRDEHYPAGRFDGVIGGPPCQMFSSLADIVRQRGHQPEFGNLIPEFERVISESEPQWFLMENVIAAPRPNIDGYEVHSFLLNNRQCMDENGKPATQSRDRRWSFGWRGARRVLQIDLAVLQNPVYEHAACGGHSGTLARVDRRRVAKPDSVCEWRRGTNCIGMNFKTKSAFGELKRLQGLPSEFDLPPFLVAAKCKAVGNGVPLPMGLAIARAVAEVTKDSRQDAKPQSP